VTNRIVPGEKTDDPRSDVTGIPTNA